MSQTNHEHMARNSQHTPKQHLLAEFPDALGRAPEWGTGATYVLLPVWRASIPEWGAGAGAPPPPSPPAMAVRGIAALFSPRFTILAR
jgi:hypothetical protein